MGGPSGDQKVMISILRRFYAQCRPYMSSLLGAIFCMIIVDGVAYVFPLGIRYIIDRLYPYISEPGVLQKLFCLFLILLSAAFIRGLATYFMVRGFWFTAESTVKNLRDSLYEKLQHLDLSFYDRSRTGDLMSRMTVDIQLIRNFFAFGIEHRLRLIIITVTVFTMMIILEWRLALVVYAFIPLIYIILLAFSKRMRIAVLEKQKQMGSLNARIQENISGIRVVKAFAMEEEEKKKFRHENQIMLDKDLKFSLLQIHLSPLMVVINSAGSLLIMLYGGYRVITGQLTLGVLAAFIAYLGVMRFPFMILAFNTSLINMAKGASDRIQEIMDGPDQKRYDTGTLKDPIKGKIIFEHISFSYNNGSPVLEDLNFTIQPGEKVALFGLTGAGKSTLISLIPRFYLPSKGRILVDGHDLREWDLTHLRSQTGIVLQETFLFSDTLSKNIAFGTSNAEQEMIVQAARHAHIHDFIETLPDKYESVIGEYGIGLSGGQQQRVAIARTLLQDPRLLILDDCTSSLDASTERQIQDELKELMKGRTTIIIAQRVSTLALADRIIVLSDGKIENIDSHEKLIETNELYRSAYEAQMISPQNVREVT